MEKRENKFYLYRSTDDYLYKRKKLNDIAKILKNNGFSEESIYLNDLFYESESNPIEIETFIDIDWDEVIEVSIKRLKIKRNFKIVEDKEK